MSLPSIYQQKIIKNYQNFLGKGLKYQFIGMNIKPKVRFKIQPMNIDIFSKSLESMDICFSLFKSR